MTDPWRPELSKELGMPEPEEMLAHFVAEHAADSGFVPLDDGTVLGVIGFGGLTCVKPWPTDEELAAARARIPTLDQ